MTWVAQVLTTSIRGGKQKKTSESDIRQGMLVKQDSSGSTVSKAGINQRIFGIAFGADYRAYAPASEIFSLGAPITVVWGDGEALLSAECFTGGTLPNAGDQLYAGASGLWTTSGSATERIGMVQQIVSQSAAAGGVNGTQNLAHVRFSIKAV